MSLFDGDNMSDSQKALSDYVARLTALDAERKALGEDMSEIMAEAKRRGFDVKALRKAFALSKAPREERAVFHEYAETLGLWDE